MSFWNWTPFFNKPGPLVSHAGSSRLPQRPLRLLALLRSRQREFLVSLRSPKRAPQHSANNFASDYNTQVLTLGPFSMYFFMETVKWKQESTKNTGLGIMRISGTMRSEAIGLYIFVPHRCHVRDGAVWSVVNPDTHAADALSEVTGMCKAVLPNVTTCRLPRITGDIN